MLKAESLLSFARSRTFVAALTLFAALTIMSASASAQVSVTATAGTLGPTPYTTLKGAFDAVNAGTHQGAVTISITASTAEGATPAVLNSSGAGTAVYTSVSIRPTVDGVTIAGASPTGRGVIELNGADNVTIDGDNPNTGGTNQNLTIQNTAVNTTTFTSVVRIALSTLITSSDNDVIKNCIILGSATGRNVAAATSQAGSEFTTYGILVGGGASTVSATTAPSAIASVTTTIGAGITASNFTSQNNQIDACARGIAVQGAATTVANGLTITSNTIGNAAAGNTTTVYARAMTLQGFDNASVFGNTVRNIEGWFNTQLMGISLGDISASGQNMVVERNNVTNVNNRNIGTFGAYGINVAAGNNNTVRNNFVSAVTGDMTGGAAFSTTFGIFGIRVGTGTGHKIYHNSVNLFGLRSGTATTSLLGASFAIVATTQTGMDVRNNIFVNNLSGGTTSIAYVAVYLPSGGTSAMNLTLNNNDYFNSAAPAANQGVGQAGTTAGTNFFTQANFDPTVTTPASNFRSYTSTLSAAGTNDNASKKVDPLFTSTTDLHIAVASPMVDGGATVGVGNDIDGQTRVPPPDIGADEPSGITPAVNDMAATAIVDPPPGSTRSTTTSITPQASFNNAGTAAQTNVPVRFRILNSSLAVVYNMTTTIPSINSGQTLNASFPSVTLSPADTYTTQAIAELVGDTNAGNDMVSGTVNVINPIAAGTYTVGSGGNYPSLTNTGGAFEAINAAGATGAITLNVISDLPGELGTHALNAIAGGFAVSIKPSGAARLISGTSTGTGLIKLNGADNVTIDGSLSGGTDRSLTITNGNAGATVIWIASASAADGSSGNTVKNCILTGNAGTTIIAGVLAGSGTTFGGDGETANSNNTIQNNQIFRVQNAVFLRGNGTSLDQNWLITGNSWGSTVAADKLLFRGMLIGNAQNFTVSNNTIAGISSTAVTSSTMSGIQVALIINGGTITGNKISDIRQNNTAGWGSNGLYFTSSSTAANITVANNFVSDVASQGFNDVTDVDNGYGIVVATGGGYKIYHNSVLMNSNQGANAATGITAAVNVLTGLAAGAVDLRDNVLVSTQTLGTRYAVICSSANTVFSSINYNDYFAQNVGLIGGTPRATLANWQTGTGQDANSLSVDPLFVTVPAPADLHLQAGSPVLGTGILIAGINNDIDNDMRDDIPDMGADELVSGRTGTIPAGTYRDANIGTGTLAGNVTIDGVLTLSGKPDTGANTLTISCTGSVTGASATNYILGNLQKQYCATGSKTFEVGTANGFSPVTVNITAGTFPANFTVKAVQGPNPAVNPATSIQRYWTLTGSGVTADLLFQYLLADVMGTEANYKVIREIGGTAVGFPLSSVNVGLHQATLSNVSVFSNWTVGQIVAPTAGTARLSGVVTRSDGQPLGGVTIRLSGSQSARAITDGHGLYSFSNLESNGFYTVTPDLTDYSFSPSSRSFSLVGDRTDAVFTATRDSNPRGNPLTGPDFFVRQQYLDFLGREPDMRGWLFWTDQLYACGADVGCVRQKRIDISAAFFTSAEYQEGGNFVYRLYRAGLGRRLTYDEFNTDRQQVVGGPELENSRRVFADNFVQRAEFRQKYDGIDSGPTFVDALLQSARLDAGVELGAQREALLAAYNAGANREQSRSAVLQAVAEAGDYQRAVYNHSFVVTQYFGYLHRNPDANGLSFWLDVLNQRDSGNYRGMVCSFLTSTEYQLRFSPVAVNSNAECGGPTQ